MNFDLGGIVLHTGEAGPSCTVLVTASNLVSIRKKIAGKIGGGFFLFACLFLFCFVLNNKMMSYKILDVSN